MFIFIPKEEFLTIWMHQVCGTMPNLVCSMETSEVSVAYISQPQHGNSIHYVFPNGMVTQSAIDMLDTTFHQNLSTHHHPLIVSASSQVSKNVYFDTISCIIDSISHVFDTRKILNFQVGAFWEDDLQNVTSCGHMAQLGEIYCPLLLLYTMSLCKTLID